MMIEYTRQVSRIGRVFRSQSVASLTMGRCDSQRRISQADSHRRLRRSACACLWGAAFLLLPMLLGGCGPTYRELRTDGQRAMARGDYGTGRELLIAASARRPGNADNLDDLGRCSVMLARNYVQRRNRAAALRELDRAMDYYNRAIMIRPNHHGALMGKNIALELRGKYDEALASARWAAKYVGPSAREQIFLALEYEERGDFDGALLRFRQAVAMEPDNAYAHLAMAEFLTRRSMLDDARVHTQTACRLDPQNRRARDLLTRLRSTPRQAPSAQALTAQHEP